MAVSGRPRPLPAALAWAVRAPAVKVRPEVVRLGLSDPRQQQLRSDERVGLVEPSLGELKVRREPVAVRAVERARGLPGGSEELARALDRTPLA